MRSDVADSTGRLIEGAEARGAPSPTESVTSRLPCVILSAVTAPDPDSPLYNGVEWWKLDYWPGTKKPFGGTPKLAAYLYFNLKVGDTFTMRDLRAALGDEVDEAGRAEHLNRRLRTLREQDWQFPSYMDQLGQDQDVYILKAKGKRIWLGERTKRDKPSRSTMRLVFERDLNTCQVCGARAGEEYEGEPGTCVRLTVGHRVPGARLANASPDNLQAECSRCNEPVGDAIPDPETLSEVMSAVSRLGPNAKAELLSWMASGYRHRSKTDIAYARIRRLPKTAQAKVADYLKGVVGGGE